MTETEPIGIIIVSHGKLGSAILYAAESIVGTQTDCVTISVDIAHQVEDAIRRLEDAASMLDKGKGVIILTDMFGGTPTNLALSLFGKSKVEIITGINLPMLLKVIESRASNSLEELAVLAQNAGSSGIVNTGKMLRSRGKDRDVK